MKVHDYYGDMILEQKYAIEFDNDSLGGLRDTLHFQCGPSHKIHPAEFDCKEVRFFRVVADEIVLCV